jgi:diaminopimelate epimerase
MLHFDKYQGLGNDFVLLDGENALLLSPPKPEVIQAICNRRFGIGSDGLILILNPESTAAIKMIYYNADGSFAETCFNGLRCVALHAVRSGRVEYDTTFIIESPTGPVTASVDSTSGKASIELDGPSFNPALVPVISDREVIEERLSFAFGALQGTALSIGNPHFVAWQENTLLSELIKESKRIGADVENSRHFPRATNFELASVRSQSLVEMAVWERGVGPTLACGSGATATVCAGVKSGRLQSDRPINVRMQGGELSIEVDSNYRRVKVIGGEEFVFEGKISLSSIGLK